MLNVSYVSEMSSLSEYYTFLFWLAWVSMLQFWTMSIDNLAGVIHIFLTLLSRLIFFCCCSKLDILGKLVIGTMGFLLIFSSSFYLLLYLLLFLEPYFS